MRSSDKIRGICDNCKCHRDQSELIQAKGRAGFTALELVVVLALLSLLGGMAAFGVMAALRRGAVNQAVASIEQAVAHARVVARGAPDGDNVAVVIDGAAERKGVRVERSGETLYEQPFGDQVHLFVDGKHSAGSRSIAFARGTGFTTDCDRGRGKRVSLGRHEDLVLATPDGQVATRFAIYEIGMVYAAEVQR